MTDTHVIWKLKCAEWGSNRLIKALARGWEPFGIHAADEADYVYLRRMVLVKTRGES